MDEKPIVKECDVLVAGGGIGGCFAAIKAKESGADKVVQICKGHVGHSGCSAFGAGNFSAVNPEEQDLDEIFADVVQQADYIPDQGRLEDHLEENWERALEMDRWGVEFEKNPDGTFRRIFGRGSGGSILPHGSQMMAALGKVPYKMGVEQVNKVMLTDLLTRHGRCIGAVALDFVKGRFFVIKARATILATGPCRYKGVEPSQRDVTGDGQAAAYRAGVDMTQFDMNQRNGFPYRWDIIAGNYGIMGLGGRWCNARGEYFLEKYDPVYKDKALFGSYIPAFSAEVKVGNGPIYTDLTHFTPEQVQLMRRILPDLINMYERVGIVKGDRFVTKIEWGLSGPRIRGGPLVNRKMESSLPGLYSVGDSIPQAGFEGGQYGLAGAATSGAIAGRNAAVFARTVDDADIDWEQVGEHRKTLYGPMNRKEGIEPDQVTLAILDAISSYDAITITNENNLKKALKEIEHIRDYQVPRLLAYDPHYLRMAFEARNMALMAEAQIRAILFREETRRSMIVLREDFPYTDNQNWLKWVSIKDTNGEMGVETHEIPIEQYKIRPVQREKYLSPVWKALQDMGRTRMEGGRMRWV